MIESSQMNKLQRLSEQVSFKHFLPLPPVLGALGEVAWSTEDLDLPETNSAIILLSFDLCLQTQF